MTLFLLSFAVVALSFLGLAVGVLLGRPPIKGSCGGVGSGGQCELCGSGVCRKRRSQAEAP